MPQRIAKPCRNRLCGRLHRNKSGYCAEHEKTDTGWAKWQAKKGSDTKRGYGWAWRKLRERILKRDKFLCQECKRNSTICAAAAAAAVVDHIIPKAEGGTDDDSNLQALCKPCHGHKTAAEGRKGRG